VNYPVEFARVLRSSSPGAVFSFLSGSGADPTGRSRMPFARYKGEAENALLMAGFPHVYIFRPAYIYPVKPRKEPNFTYRLLRTIYPAFRALFPNQVISADDLARAIVDVVVSETEQRGGPVFENRDIRAMVESLPTHQRRTDETINELLRNDALVEDSTCVVVYNSPGSSRSPCCN
jgi:uncharacterized protein YbjT (DUF2867 family)